MNNTDRNSPASSRNMNILRKSGMNLSNVNINQGLAMNLVEEFKSGYDLESTLRGLGATGTFKFYKPRKVK